MKSHAFFKWTAALFLFMIPSMLSAGEPVESSVRIRLYGFVRVEMLYDNTEIVQGDWMFYARPGSSAYAGRPVFTISARHSRVGLDLTGPQLGKQGAIQGKIEVDFAGGFPNSSTAARQARPRLRLAFVDIVQPAWELKIGQDLALISGPFPNTGSFLLGAGMGNLWNHIPQVRATLKTGVLKCAASLNRPMAGNVKYDEFANGDFDPVDDGERTGLPWGMARAWIAAGSWTGSVSGHYGRERIDDLSGVPHHMASYSLNLDMQLKTGPASWTVRAFTGENLNTFFGGVLQGFTRDSSTVSNIAARGGWAQVLVRLGERWAATVGCGTDDPADKDLTAGMRSRNDWVLGNVALTLKKSLTFMLEASYLKTSYIGDEAGKNLRIQAMTVWNF